MKKRTEYIRLMAKAHNEHMAGFYGTAIRTYKEAEAYAEYPEQREDVIAAIADCHSDEAAELEEWEDLEDDWDEGDWEF